MRPEFSSLPFPVSRETYDKLVIFEQLLTQWQRTINLTADSSTLWPRHILDSLQLLSFFRDTSVTVADIGSGGGFPGLILAIAGVRHVHLIESDKRKCAFLREAARLTNTDVTIHPLRVEEMMLPACDFITARACASLSRLLLLTHALWKPGTKGLFLKGQHFEDELRAAQSAWQFRYSVHPSLTAPDGRILMIEEVSAL